MTDEQVPSITELLTHRRFLEQLALQLTGERGSADDLVQETWLSAIERPPRHGANLSAWLRRVVRHLYYRRKHRDAFLKTTELDPVLCTDDGSAEQLAEQSETLRQIGDLMLQLDEPYRSVVLLRFFEGKTPTQIASQLDRSVNTVTSQLARGVDRLRSRLEPRHGDGRSRWSMAWLPFGWPRRARAAVGRQRAPLRGSRRVTVRLAHTTMVVVAGVIALSSLVLFLWRSSWTRDARAAESVAAAPPASPPILDPPSISGMREAVDSSAPPPSADWLEVVDDAGEPLVGTSVQVSRKEAAASEPGIRAAAPAPPTRGRLVDEATLEPIPDALVATSKRNDWTDANGWFDTGDLLDGLDDLLVVNFGDNSNKSEIPKASWTRTRHAWQIPLTIGPTFRLRFRDGDVPHPGTWEARLMRESDSDGVWHGLHKGSPPYIRFGAPLRELVAGEHAWIEARSLDGLNDGRGDVSSLVGVHEVEIACRQRAVLRGRVVDEKGLPWRYVMLNAVQLSRGAEESLHASTGADGTYQLSAREPGTMLVAFRQGFYARAQDLQTHVPLGVTQAPDTVLERLPTGTIRGRLRRSTREVPVPCSLRLRALEGSEFEVVRDFVLGEPRVGERAKLAQEKDPTDAQEFQFQSIPAGSYELTAISMDGFACSPAALQVRTPAEGIDFSFDNGVQRRSYVLNLVDAGSGAALEPIFADVLVDGAWSDSDMLPDRGGPLVTLAEGIGFEWRATSPGYEMTRGSDADFHLEGESLVATRALRPGFAVRLRLRNQIAGQDASELAYSMSVRWGTPAVAGADVLADGELVATSDADGIADVQLASEPARIEIRLAGWRVLDSPSFRKGRPLSLPTSEVWMVRE